MKRFLSKFCSISVAAAIALSVATSPTDMGTVSAYAQENAESDVIDPIVSEIQPGLGSIYDVGPSFSFFGMNETTFNGSYYEQLDEESKKVYNTLKTEFGTAAHTNKVTIDVTDEEFVGFYEDGELNDDENAEILAWVNDIVVPGYLALIYDSPELSWICNVRYQISTDSINIVENDIIVSDVSFQFTEAPTNTGSISDAISNAKTTINSNISNSTESYDIVRGIHNYLCNTIEYNDTAANAVQNIYSAEQLRCYQTAYSAFYPCNGETEIKTVCAGYARGFKALCDSYGIPCVYVSGDAGGAHAWNYVRMEDNKWYAVDVTWDDQDDLILYDYFLVGSDSFTDHTESGSWTQDLPMAFAYPELSTANYEPSGGISITPEDVTIGELSYSGSELFPEITVKVNGNSLTLDTDYTLSGTTSATNAGEYTVTVTGTGNYKGTVEKTWSIAKGKPTVIITATTATGRAYAGQKVEVTAVAKAPNDEIEEDLSISFSYKIGDGTPVNFTGSFIIPRDTTDGAIIYIIASTNETDNYLAMDTTTDIGVNQCTDHTYDNGPCANCGIICGTCGGDLKWTLVDGTITISGTGAMNNYENIAPYYTAPPWYNFREDIKNVIIEEGVTTIGDYAFGCDKLVYPNLENVSIPASVTSIGVEAFRLCSGLTTVNFADNSKLTTISGGVFSDCGNLVNITIPEGVKTIGFSAFVQCYKIDITIPEGVTSIGRGAFMHCRNLKDIRIPEGVTSIESSTFSGCYGLTEITIHENINNIGDYAFIQCYNLKTVNILANDITIESGTFEIASNATVNVPCGWRVNPRYTFTDATVNYAEHSNLTYSVSGNVLTEHCGVCNKDSGTLTISADNCTYDKTAHGATVTGTGAFENAEVTVEYFKDGVSIGNEAPVNAGEYTAKVNYSENEISASYTIAKADPEVTHPEAIEGLTYTGEAQALITAGSTTGGTIKYSTDGENYSTDIPTGTAVGEYTISYKVFGDENYNDSEEDSITVYIAKTAPIVTPPTAIEGLTFTGEAQALITAGSAVGGTMKYSLSENGDYSEDIPKAVSAGEHTVWYKVIGDVDHSDTEPASVKVNIAKMKVTAAVYVNDKIYDGETDAVVTVDDIVSGYDDCAQISGLKGYFSDANVGNNKTVTLDPSSVVITGSGYENFDISFPETSTANITHASITNATAAQLGEITFDGKAHKPEFTVTLSDGSIITAADFDVTVDSKTNAGSYTATIAGKGNYKDSISGSWTIKAASIEDTEVSYAPLTYNGVAQTPVFTITLGDYTLAETDYSVTVEEQTAAGTHTATITGSGSNFTGTKSVQWSIDKKKADAVASPTATNEITYGQALSAVTLSDNTWSWTDGTVIPEVKNTGFTATKSVDDENYNYTEIDGYNPETHKITRTIRVTVNKATPTVTAPTAKTGTYTGEAQELINAGSTTGGTIQYSLNGTTYSTDIPKATDAGAYTVYYKVIGGDNYADVAAESVSVTIAKAASTVTAPTAKADLHYAGKAQALITAGSATGGTIKYSLDGAIYSTTIPTATNPGTYTVYYMVEGDKNHENTTPASVEVEISKTTPTIVVTATSAKTDEGTKITVSVEKSNPYNTRLDDIPTPVVSYKIGEGEFTVLSDTNSFVVPVDTENGTTITITALIEGNELYDTRSDTTTVLITDCTHEGTTELKFNETSHWYDCTNCGATDIDKAAHSGGTATCVSKAVCEVCTKAYGVINENKHTPDNQGWHSDSESHWHVCKDCTAIADKSIHTSDGGKVTTAATATATGVKTYSCIYCGFVIKTETIPATGSSGGSGGGSSDGGDYPSYPVVTPSNTTATQKTETPVEDEKDDKEDRDNDTTKPADTAEPQIKGDNGKTGWEAIADDITDTEEGGKVVVDMNGATEVPEDIFELIKGQDIDLVIELDNGFKWTINGEDVTDPMDINLGVNEGSEIPVKIINKVTGDCSYKTITLSHEGDFGFKAVLTVDMGEENEGFYANLYWYTNGGTKFICADKISSRGKADLTFTHASEYVIVIDEESHGKRIEEVEEGEEVDGEIEETEEVGDDENPFTGVAISFTGVIISAAAVLLTKKRRK